MQFSIVSAVDGEKGIGKKNDLAWMIRGDLKHFSEVTKGAVVIMGYNTWISLPENHRPLSGRLNVVLSYDKVDLPEGVLQARSFEEAFELIEKREERGTPGPLAGVREKREMGGRRDENGTFVIGGASIYAQAIVRPECERLYVTEVEGVHGCDVFFPKIDEGVWRRVVVGEWMEERGERFRFVEWERGDDE